MSDKKTEYQYAGDGLGVPGLPHRVTKEEAERLGLLADLEAAITRGDYKPAAPAKGQAPEEAK